MRKPLPSPFNRRRPARMPGAKREAARRQFYIRAGVALVAGFILIGTLSALPPAFREYAGVEYQFEIPLPADYREPGEWTFARLMYPPNMTYRRAAQWSRGLDWRQGGTTWTIDYPRGDRHVAQTVRRLTRIDARSVEQPVNLDDGDEVFYWPWLYVVEPGTWALTDAQVAKLREYLLRGGFLMADDFHGAQEWELFMEGMRRIFPDRPVVDIPSDDPIFHTVWDIDDRQQIPGEQYLYTGLIYEFNETGIGANWRGIYDDHGRLMVAICHNMDLGDAVEHADNPLYPEEWSAQAMRIFINYIVYSMTH
jgi:hypothetical protein